MTFAKRVCTKTFCEISSEADLDNKRADARDVLWIAPNPQKQMRVRESEGNCFSKICSDSEEGSYLRLIDFLITQL